MNLERIPTKVIHYSEFDPQTTTGGVQTFARNLAMMFDEVGFMTPKQRDFDRIRAERIPLVCDNQYVTDVPEDIPVIGFQHGVGEVKAEATGRRTHRKLAKRQAKAAARPNTIWVACAEWISRTFGELHDNPAQHVIYHPIDVERFDGQLNNEGSKLILHDGRTEHKGKKLWPHVVRAYPDWDFDFLNCKPEEVPDRMRKGRAFVHLSRYEGNSIVCNEAMAMNLPCLFTRVGLMQDQDRPRDVYLVDASDAYGNVDLLVREMGEFLDSLSYRTYRPRKWTLSHATPEHSLASWRAVMADFDKLSGWDLGLKAEG